MQNPNVAILHYSAPPVIGGVESTIAAHARLLASHGYPVRVVTGRGEAFDARVPVQVIPALDSKHALVLKVNAQLTRGIVSEDFDSLAASIREGLSAALTDADICIAHNVLTLHKNLALTYALFGLARSTRMRLIGWCHDFAWQDPLYAHELHAGRPWDLLRQPWAEAQYVVVSEARRRDLAQLLNLEEEAIEVVPPGLNPGDFLSVTPAVRSWMHSGSLLQGSPLLLLPARVTRRKNIELAIEITAALRALGLSATLMVMGPLGPHNPANRVYLDELLALRRARDVERAVVFMQEYGEVTDAQRRDLYLLADALLFTSMREGFGIPILEAGLTRLPIFCSDIAPFRESAGPYAQYFKLDETPALIARRIADWFERDACYQLKQRVLCDYSWPRIMADRIEPLLKEN
jgi:glycosyltransferase involved in cell wall biosynthesis